MPLTLHIESLAAGGDGVGHHAGRAIFVSGVASGETVEVELAAEHQGFAKAELVRVVTPSPDRVRPVCAHQPQCGGCPWMHLSSQAQHRAKENLLRDALERIGGIQPDAYRLNPLVASPQQLHYRQRATLHMSGGRLGYRARASHALVEIDECQLLDQRLEAAILRLQGALDTQGCISRLTDVALAGDARRITAAFLVDDLVRPKALDRMERLLRSAGLDGGVLVSKQGVAPGAAPGADQIAIRHLGDTVLSYPAPLANNVLLHGRADLFAQANGLANELLVGEALRQATTSNKPTSVLELYAGAGNFTFALSRVSARVTAVEWVADALDLARQSAREASIDTVRFIQGDSLKVADALAREGQAFDLLLLDPPRAGAKGIGPLAKRLGVKQVVYVSCEPSTLGRDLRDLVAAGFVLREATPVDMFAQTFHVEAVARLEKA